MSLADIFPPDWIDLAPGDAYVVRKAFLDQFELPQLTFEPDQYISRINHCNYPRKHQTLNYPHPAGFAPLIKKLEAKHNAPIIITNGAKQGLAAVFYALKQMGKTNLGYQLPAWGLIPPLAKEYGLERRTGKRFDCFLCVMPNNPDGSVSNLDSLQRLQALYREYKAPFIHDAAYYSPVYLPWDYETGKIGDVQIFSISKMFGLSSLRLGYLVIHNLDFYKHLQNYMEMMTVGVSTFTQAYLCELFEEVEINKHKFDRFVSAAKSALYDARLDCQLIDTEIMDILTPMNSKSSPMFLWAKLLKRTALKDAKINVVYGEDEYRDYVRMNLAAPRELLRKAIGRISKFVRWEK